MPDKPRDLDLEDFDVQVEEARQCLKNGQYATARALMRGGILAIYAAEHRPRPVTVTLNSEGFVAGAIGTLGACRERIDQAVQDALRRQERPGGLLFPEKRHAQ